MKQPFPYQVIVIQPVVPSYRNGFFNGVASILGSCFTVHASDLDMGVLTEQTEVESWRRKLGPMVRLGPGIEWQCGAMSVPIKRGDIVIVSGAPRCLSNIAVLLKARMHGAQTVWWGQLWSATSRWPRFILRLVLMRLASSVIFYTDAEVAAYKAHFSRWDGRAVGALNNGIDVRPIRTRRVPYDVTLRPKDILFLGRLTEKAQLSLLLEAMTAACLKDATLHVVGDGPDQGGLQDWAGENGLQGRVIWHGATVNESEIADIANQSAAFCYPGGVGLSLIHAMAYGLPAVVHDDPDRHMPEIAAFKHGVTGTHFKKGDANSLAKTLAALLADPTARECMSKEAICRADDIYNTDRMALRFVDFVRNRASEQTQ